MPVEGVFAAAEQVPGSEVETFQERAAPGQTLVANDAQRRVFAQSDNAVVFDVNVRELADMGDAVEIIEARFERAGLERGVVVRTEAAEPSRLPRRAEAEVPLAHAARGVARGAQQLRQRHALGVDQQRVVGPDAAALRPCPPSVTAGQQAVSRGRTDRVRRVRVGEAHALFGQPVDVGGLDLRRPIATQVAVAQIVGQDENDIRQSAAGSPKRQAEQKQAAGNAHRHAHKIAEAAYAP